MPTIEIQKFGPQGKSPESNKNGENDQNDNSKRDDTEAGKDETKFTSPCWCATVGDEASQSSGRITSQGTQNRFPYPTWTLLQRNECPNLMRRISLRGIGHTLVEDQPERALSAPPPCDNGQRAQRSATKRIRDDLKRARSLGCCLELVDKTGLGMSKKSSFRNTSYFGKDFSEKSCSEDEQKLGNLSLRTQSSFTTRATNGVTRNLGEMPLPSTVTAQVACYMSSIARMKMIKHLSDIQRGYHTCVGRERDINKKCDGSDLVYTSRPRKVSNLKLQMDVAAIPRPSKVQGTEDAYWLDEEGRAFMVADGVGEWYSYGINPGEFSRAVVNITKRLFLKYEGYSIIDAENEAACANLTSLIGCMREISHPDSLMFGATTVIMASLYENGSKICVTNLGDCTFMLLRRDNRRQFKMNIVKRTKESLHSFNCPKQLLNFPSANKYDLMRENGMDSIIPHIERARKLAQERGVAITSDHPLDSDSYSLAIKEGDLIVCGSDGVFDNLFDHEIADICSYAISPFEAELMESYSTTCTDSNSKPGDCTRLIREWLRGRLPHPAAMEPPEMDKDADGNLIYYTPAKNIASALVQAALSRALDPKSSTPFCKNAKRAGFDCRGGKLDDTTVVAAWVVPNSSANVEVNKE